MEIENIAGVEGTATPESASVTENTQETVADTVKTQPGSSKPERTFTQSQVNDIMKRRVERSHNAFFTRYGVKDLNELDNLFGKAGDHDTLTAERDELTKKYGDLENDYKDLTKRYAYKSCNISDDKIQDIETYFKGKGIDIDENTLIKELKAHPDWANKVATIQQLGAEASVKTEADERAEAARIFGVKL